MFSFILHKLFFLEIRLQDDTAGHIETAEDAFGDEIYQNCLRQSDLR